MAQSPTNYTLQILGVRDESAIIEYVRENKLWNKTAYFHTRYKGNNWYPLLYGSYENRDKAQAAIAKLPENVKRTPPWVRNFAGIQQEIKDSARR